MRAALSLLMLPLLAAPSSARAENAGFMLCEALPHITCVWSGNSFYLRGRLIRLVDIDVPQRYTSECPAASNLSWLSAGRLRDLLNAGTFDLEPANKASSDESEPHLVTRNGKSLGDDMVAAGLAKAVSAAQPEWCS